MIFTVNVLPKSEFSGNEVAQRKRAVSGEHNVMSVKYVLIMMSEHHYWKHEFI